jgi:hypothetical protein
VEILARGHLLPHDRSELLPRGAHHGREALMASFGSTSCLARSVEDGFEKYTFEIKTDWFLKTAQEDKRNPGALKRWVRIYYEGQWGWPMPFANEIDSITANDAERESMTRLSLTIRRGHWVLLDFLKKHIFHGGFSTQISGSKVVALCNCGEMEIVEGRTVR